MSLASFVHSCKKKKEKNPFNNNGSKAPRVSKYSDPLMPKHGHNIKDCNIIKESPLFLCQVTLTKEIIYKTEDKMIPTTSGSSHLHLYSIVNWWDLTMWPQKGRMITSEMSVIVYTLTFHMYSATTRSPFWIKPTGLFTTGPVEVSCSVRHCCIMSSASWIEITLNANYIDLDH